MRAVVQIRKGMFKDRRVREVKYGGKKKVCERTQQNSQTDKGGWRHLYIHSRSTHHVWYTV